MTHQNGPYSPQAPNSENRSLTGLYVACPTDLRKRENDLAFVHFLCSQDGVWQLHQFDLQKSKSIGNIDAGEFC
jgi:hypothetical protein